MSLLGVLALGAYLHCCCNSGRVIVIYDDDDLSNTDISGDAKSRQIKHYRSYQKEYVPGKGFQPPAASKRMAGRSNRTYPSLSRLNIKPLPRIKKNNKAFNFS